MAVDATGSRSGVRFEERQTFPPWMGPALVALSAPPIVAASVLVFADAGVTVETAAIAIATVVLGASPLPLVRRSALRTEVRADGVRFRYRPFHRSYRRIPFDAIAGVEREESRAYSYGIRWTRSGWVYAPDASEGVRVYRENGKPIFLGSERPSDLLSAIEAGRRRARERDGT